MFTTVSKSGVGMYVVVVVTLMQSFGLDIDQGMATEGVMAVLNGLGALLWIVGTIMRKDLSWGIFRKEG